MTRREFMNSLERYLDNIPANEKSDALIYYRDYFEDAGITEDMEVPESVGNPAHIAEKLKEDIGTKNYYEGGNGYAGSSYNNENSYSYGNEYNSTETGENKSNTNYIIAAIVLILTSPLWIAFLGAAVGIIAGAFLGIAGVSIGGIVGGVAVVIVGIAGATVIETTMIIGIGLVMIGIGLLSLSLLVLICGKFIPWLVIKISKLCTSLFGRKERV